MTLSKLTHNAYLVSYFSCDFLITKTCGIWHIFDEDGRLMRVAQRLSDAVTYLEQLAASA